MDTQRVRAAMESAFASDLQDGTVKIGVEDDSVVLDGGNWSMVVHSSGVVSLGLPMNDANYYDEDTNAFLENVLNLEVEESLAMLDRSLDGAIVQGLRLSQESWSDVLANRISLILV